MKTVPEIVDEVCEEFCDSYCKWPEKCMEQVRGEHAAEEPDELYMVDMAEELLMDEHCKRCPMNRI